MSIGAFIKRTDRRYAWSLLGFLLAVIFGLLTIYTEFIRGRNPDINFQIISDTNVLDVKERLSNLEITYDGNDIQKSNQNLRVMIIKAKNIGSQDILKTSYDDEIPFGLRLHHGLLIRVETIASSSAYLRDNLSIKIQSSNHVLIKPIIIERDEWFTLKLLILAHEESRTIIEPIGKIAGINRIRIINLTEADNNQGFLKKAFGGNILTQSVRSIGYFIITIVAAIVIFYLYYNAWEFNSKRKRKNKIRSHKTFLSDEISPCLKLIFYLYICNGKDYLTDLFKIISHEERLNDVMKDYSHGKKIYLNINTDYLTFFERIRSNSELSTQTIDQMIQFGCIVKNNEKWHPDDRFVGHFKELVRYIPLY